jgi:predicted O-linked N-acetylglucosamine transferase (SPINDLY family)
VNKEKFHHQSFITEETALNFIIRAKNLAIEDPTKCLDNFHEAFLLQPTLYVLEAARYVLSLLGDAPGVGEWVTWEISGSSSYRKYHLLTENYLHLYHSNRWEEALIQGAALVKSQPCALEILFLAALIHQKQGKIDSAKGIYEHILECFPLHTKSMVNLGSLYQQHSDRSVQKKSIELYTNGIHGLQQYRASYPGYVYLNDNELKMRANLGLAYYQNNNFQDAFRTTQRLIELIEELIELMSNNNGNHDISNLQTALQGALGNQVIIARAAVSWEGHEERLHQVLHATIRKYLRFGNHSELDVTALLNLQGPYLPFDSLLDEVTLNNRLQIAQLASLQFQRHTQTITHVSVSARATSLSSLNIAMYSTDFRDHPTAHLIVGLFTYLQHRKSAFNNDWYKNIRLVVYNYGSTPQSCDYRRILQSLADRFVDTFQMDHHGFIDLVHNDRIDIFLEMQVHTLNNRLDYTARLSSSQSTALPEEQQTPFEISGFINYLVYPGTSGSSFLDHLICDAVVVPPEHSSWYSEKLLMLPPTYQISSYIGLGLVSSEVHCNSASISKDLYASRELNDSMSQPCFPHTLNDIAYLQRLYRRRYGLPVEEDAIIFANFNKIDKLDSESFSVWMQLLREIPRSFLWLMLPGKVSNIDNSSFADDAKSISEEDHFQVVLRNLQLVCAYHGVDWSSRIIIAERTKKKFHIERHLAADLFLDSFVYGAHSTSTDALRGVRIESFGFHSII